MLEVNPPQAYEMGLGETYGTPCPFIYSELEQAFFEGQMTRLFEQGKFIWDRSGQFVIIDNKVLKLIWSENK